MRYARILFCLFLVLSLSLASCGWQDPVAAERLSELLGAIPCLPAGTCYDSATRDFMEGAPLTDELIEALYAREDGACEYAAHVREAAVYLSSVREPYLELAVFVCYGSADTAAVFEMCHRRARLVASLGVAATADAMVSVSGRVVTFCLTSDPEAVKEALSPYI